MTATGSERMLVASGSPVDLPGLPDVAGLSVRRWRDEADLEGFAALVNASWVEDGIEIRTSPPNEANELRHLTGFELEHDMVVVERDGTMVAFGRVNTDTEDDGTRRHWVSVMLAPPARGLGLEAALLDWAEDRQRTVAAAEPKAAPRRFGAWAAERESWWVAFLEARGYRPVRWFTDMVRDTLGDLPALGLPPGLESRPVRAEDLRTIIAADDEAFIDHWGHGPLTEDDVVGIIEHPYTDPSLWSVAWDGDEVAALVMGSVMVDENEAFGWRRGWLNSVGTRRPWRKRGLASALIAETLAKFRERGLDSAGLGVDTANPSGALGLYERLGFRVDQRFLILYRPFE
jgi:GNAT superfamily N-acetyltransferase